MPSIPIQLGDLLTLAAMASKACEYMPCFAAGLVHGEKEVEAQQVINMKNDCIRVLGELDRQNPGMMPVPHDEVMWAERAAGLEGEEDESDQTN